MNLFFGPVRTCFLLPVETIQEWKLFKGGNYSSEKSIQGRKLFVEILRWFSSPSFLFSPNQITIWKVNIRLKNLGDWYWGVCSPVAQPAGFRITIINRERRATIILARDQKIFYNFSFSSNYVCLIFLLLLYTLGLVSTHLSKQHFLNKFILHRLWYLLAP